MYTPWCQCCLCNQEQSQESPQGAHLEKRLQTFAPVHQPRTQGICVQSVSSNTQLWSFLHLPLLPQHAYSAKRVTPGMHCQWALTWLVWFVAIEHHNRKEAMSELVTLQKIRTETFQTIRPGQSPPIATCQPHCARAWPLHDSQLPQAPQPPQRIGVPSAVHLLQKTVNSCIGAPSVTHCFNFCNLMFLSML
jgi:hypothetical protein